MRRVDEHQHSKTQSWTGHVIKTGPSDMLMHFSLG